MRNMADLRGGREGGSEELGRFEGRKGGTWQI